MNPPQPPMLSLCPLPRNPNFAPRCHSTSVAVSAAALPIALPPRRFSSQFTMPSLHLRLTTGRCCQLACRMKGTAPVCACWKAQMLTRCRLCEVESSINRSSLSFPMAAGPCTPSAFVGNRSRQASLIRGMRVTAEVRESIAKEAVKENVYRQKPSSEGSESDDGELGSLPEELYEELEAAARSVGLDGLNVSDAASKVCVLGVDPDASGAIAVLRTGSQEVLDVPCVEVQIGKTMRRRHDANSIVALVNSINAPEGSVAYVEQANPVPKDGGKRAWFGKGFGYGVWVGILMALGFKVVPVPLQAWKSAMGLYGRRYTKDDSRSVAVSLFPALGPQLKRKKDHGRADAILIAAFGKGLSAPPKILDEETDSIQQE